MRKNDPVKKLREASCACGFILKSFQALSLAEKKLVLEWRNNPDVRGWMYNSEKIPLHEHLAFVKELGHDRRNFYWLVEDKGEPLGVIYLNRLDERNGNAYLGIYANPSRHIPGAGTALMACLKTLAFPVAGLHTLKLEVLAANERALRFYRKNGFRTEGRLKGLVLHGGKRMDVLIMGAESDSR